MPSKDRTPPVHPALALLRQLQPHEDLLDARDSLQDDTAGATGSRAGGSIPAALAEHVLLHVVQLSDQRFVVQARGGGPLVIKFWSARVHMLKLFVTRGRVIEWRAFRGEEALCFLKMAWIFL